MPAPYAESRILEPKDVLEGPGNPRSLENEITERLTDGCVCYVKGEGGIFALDKSSSVPIDPTNGVIAAKSGGRWIRVGQAGSQSNNTPPVITMDPIPATVPPGPLVLSGTVEDDSVIGSGGLSVEFTGQGSNPTFSIEDGHWSATINLTTLGVKHITVTAIDEDLATGTASRSTTCVLPEIAITSPAQGAAVDVGALEVTAECPMPDGTTVAIRDGATSIGVGELTDGAAVITTSVLAEGDHSLTAEIVTVAGTITSAARTVHVVDALPEISEVTPANGATLAAGPVVTQATLTHAYGRPMLARARIDSGAWYALTRVGETDVYSGTSEAVTTEGSHPCTIQATDASDWNDATAISTSTTTFSVSYAVAWNAGAQTFENAFASTTAVPTNGAIALSLSETNAINGAVLRIDIPATVTSFGLTIPDGYTQTTDATIAWVDATTLDGYDPWVPGIPCQYLYRINTTAHTISVSCRRHLAQALPASALLYPVAVGGAVSTSAYNRDEQVQPSNAATVANYTAATDPLAASRRSSLGTVLHVDSAAKFSMPAAGSTNAATFATWHVTPNGMRCIGGAPSSANLNTATGAHIGGTAVIPDATTYRVFLAPGGDTTQVNLLSSDAELWGNLVQKWLHTAWVANGGQQTIYINGSPIYTGPFPEAGAWIAGTDEGQGYQLGNGGAQWDDDTGVYAGPTMAGAFGSPAAVHAHLIATSPVPSAGAHVLSIGSSLQAAGAGGDNISTTTRLATGIPTTEWHQYATSGSRVVTYQPGIPSRVQQGNRASVAWQSRGVIAILDWGNVGYEAGDLAAMIADSRVLLARGWRLIMLDFAGTFTDGVETGGQYRDLQNEYYAALGGSIIRVPMRDIMLDWDNRNGGDYMDDIHFSQRTITAASNYLATLVQTLRSQTAPAAKPDFVSY